MDRFRGLITLQLVALTIWILPAAGQTYRTTESGTVRRLDRIAASILKRKSANATNGRSWMTAQNLGQSAVSDAPSPPPSAASDSPAESIMDPAVMGPNFGSEATLFPAPDPDIGFGGVPSGDCPGCNDCQACQMYCWTDALSLWFGVDGFTGPFNRGQDGSFGIQQGVNWGSPWVFTPLCMNTQVGFRAVQSNLEGANFTNQRRQQYFLTAGLYRREECGWQCGIVFDYLNDDWNIGLNLGQLRGEISWAMPNCRSFGVRFASSVSSDQAIPGIEVWETHDWYAFFHEVHWNRCSSGVWRVFAGFTGESDGLIRTDLRVALWGSWSLEPAFTYLIPDEPRGAGGNEAEAWNIAFNLVWYPNRGMGGIDYRRLPMFDVAGNGSMIANPK